jgi:hypothetical protein
VPEIVAVQVQQIKGHDGNAGARAFLQLPLQSVKFAHTVVVLNDGLPIDDGASNLELCKLLDDEAEAVRPVESVAGEQGCRPPS